MPLAAGDVVVFYTDGLTEARREADDYGTARLAAQVEAAAGGTAAEIGERILADVDAFLGRTRHGRTTSPWSW